MAGFSLVLLFSSPSPGSRSIIRTSDGVIRNGRQIRGALGESEVEAVNRGVLRKIDDLHKGFDSGLVWYWLIDITAIILTISSISGMITLLSLRARRRSGFIVGTLAVAMLVAIYFV